MTRTPGTLAAYLVLSALVAGCSTARPTLATAPSQAPLSAEAALRMPALATPLPPLQCNEHGNILPLYRSVELMRGEEKSVDLADGTTARVKLLGVEVETDAIRGAVRSASVTVEVNGQRAALTCGTYSLPRELGGVQVDCPAVAEYLQRGRSNPWNLRADARLRLWPAGWPWVRPGSFVYPIRQRWFATNTQMSNEPAYVDGPEPTTAAKIYYHSELDIGGVEGLTEVVAAADGVVITAGEAAWDQAPPGPQKTRYDKVLVRDRRGWYQSYYHLLSIDPAITPGARVVRGQRIGLLGKLGHSGGWAHLHFGLTAPQPGQAQWPWGSEDAYAFLWQAWMERSAPHLIAVARPHHYLKPGQVARLDGSRSWAAEGVVSYAWTFTDGSAAEGPVVERRYDAPGEYAEMLTITDPAGRRSSDLAIVQVVDPDKPMPPALHLASWPTEGLAPGDAVVVVVRSFNSPGGEIVVDYGDGSVPVKVRCTDATADPLAPAGYAVLWHSYNEAGRYVVTAAKDSDTGRAVMKIIVHVE